VLGAVGLKECLREVATAIGWSERRPGTWRGKGLACGWRTTTGGSSGVYVKINPLPSLLPNPQRDLVARRVSVPALPRVAVVP
jgi:hypothetical protein